MSKRKEIEAALRQYDDDGSAENLAERTYAAGYVAGLRYAASCANEPSDVEKFRQWANARAKKARAK